MFERTLISGEKHNGGQKVRCQGRRVRNPSEPSGGTGFDDDDIDPGDRVYGESYGRVRAELPVGLESLGFGANPCRTTARLRQSYRACVRRPGRMLAATMTRAQPSPDGARYARTNWRENSYWEEHKENGKEPKQLIGRSPPPHRFELQRPRAHRQAPSAKRSEPVRRFHIGLKVESLRRAIQSDEAPMPATRIGLRFFAVVKG